MGLSLPLQQVRVTAAKEGIEEARGGENPDTGKITFTMGVREESVG